MELKDWILIGFTILACFAGSALGAGLTNRHDRKLEEQRKNRELTEKREQKETDRRRALNEILIEYRDLLSEERFKKIGTELRNRIVLPEKYSKRLEFDEFYAAAGALKQRTLLYIDYSENPSEVDRLSREFMELNSYLTSIFLIADKPESWVSANTRNTSRKGEAFSDALRKDLNEYLRSAMKTYFNLQNTIMAHDEDCLIKYPG